MHFLYDVDVRLRRCRSSAEKIQELQSPHNLLKPSYRYCMCNYPHCVLSGGAAGVNLHTCICYVSNVHPWRNNISTSKLKKILGDVDQIVNPVLISHHHIQKTNRSCEREEHVDRKRLWLKRDNESADHYIVCKHCVG